MSVIGRAKTRAGLGLVILGAVALASGCAETGGRRPAPLPASPRVAVACEDFSFPIYFERGSEQLTADAQRLITDAGLRVRGCVLGPLDVVGLADAGGSKRLSLEVSRRRADVVAGALKRSGLPAPVFDVDAVGAAGAEVSRGRREPLRRRTEVVIHASSPTGARAG